MLTSQSQRDPASQPPSFLKEELSFGSRRVRPMPVWVPRVSMATIVVAIAALILVQIASFFFPPFILPGVPAIGAALWEVVVADSANIGITLIRFTASLVLAIICGWFLGLMMGAFRSTVGKYLTPLLSILMAVPALSWILTSVLWISSIELRVIFICFIIGMPFFAVAVYEGIRDIDKDIVKAIEQFRPTRMQVVRILFIPQSLVYLLVSVRSTSSLCLRILVFAEMIGASSGIGQQMSFALANFRMDLILAWTIVMVVGNFLLVWVVDQAEKRILKWRDEAVLR